MFYDRISHSYIVTYIVVRKYDCKENETANFLFWILLFIIWKYYVDNYVLEKSLFMLIKLDQIVLLAIIICVSADAM